MYQGHIGIIIQNLNFIFKLIIINLSKKSSNFSYFFKLIKYLPRNFFQLKSISVSNSLSNSLSISISYSFSSVTFLFHIYYIALHGVSKNHIAFQKCYIVFQKIILRFKKGHHKNVTTFKS